jgi:hypothetical protein
MTWKSMTFHSWLPYPRIWCIELRDTSNVPTQVSTASVCNKCSESTPWEDFALLWFVVTTNFTPSWTL